MPELTFLKKTCGSAVCNSCRRYRCRWVSFMWNFFPPNPYINLGHVFGPSEAFRIKRKLLPRATRFIQKANEDSATSERSQRWHSKSGQRPTVPGLPRKTPCIPECTAITSTKRFVFSLGHSEAELRRFIKFWSSTNKTKNYITDLLIIRVIKSIL